MQLRLGLAVAFALAASACGSTGSNAEPPGRTEAASEIVEATSTTSPGIEAEIACADGTRAVISVRDLSDPDKRLEVCGFAVDPDRRVSARCADGGSVEMRAADAEVAGLVEAACGDRIVNWRCDSGAFVLVRASQSKELRDLVCQRAGESAPETTTTTLDTTAVTPSEAETLTYLRACDEWWVLVLDGWSEAEALDEASEFWQVDRDVLARFIQLDDGKCFRG